MPVRRLLPTIVVILAAATTPLVLACGSDDKGQTVRSPVEGDAAAGREAIDSLGCGSCHTVPGVSGADADVAPPLTDWARRAYIAGTLRNTPENLERWILEPDEIKPGTPMPDVGATDEQARDIVAHLYTIGD